MIGERRKRMAAELHVLLFLSTYFFVEWATWNYLVEQTDYFVERSDHTLSSRCSSCTFSPSMLGEWRKHYWTACLGEVPVALIDHYTCQLFLSQRYEIFILRIVRISEDDTAISLVSKNFQGPSKELHSSEVSQCDWEYKRRSIPRIRLVWF